MIPQELAARSSVFSARRTPKRLACWLALGPKSDGKCDYRSSPIGASEAERLHP